MSNIYYPLLSRRSFRFLNAAYTSTTTVPYTNYYYVNTMAAHRERRFHS